jgi:hypothetical protein
MFVSVRLKRRNELCGSQKLVDLLGRRDTVFDAHMRILTQKIGGA